MREHEQTDLEILWTAYRYQTQRLHSDWTVDNYKKWLDIFASYREEILK